MNEEFMHRAIELAKKGEGFVSPNPLVGAVIVKNKEIIAEGYHEKYGKLHAERNALKNANENFAMKKKEDKEFKFDTLKEWLSDATMYVTLEPCCHYGKQPPCTDAIIESGIKRIVIGSSDPNPLVAGKGVSILKENGIEVIEGFLKDKCDEINEVFFHYIKNDYPYITLKYAMTIDGKIASNSGKSKWISGSMARKYVHNERFKNAAVMVGIGTVLSDDPMLNVRDVEKENYHTPIRIIVDSNLQIPITSQIVQTAVDIKTIVATTKLLQNDFEKENVNLDSNFEKTNANSSNNFNFENTKVSNVYESRRNLDELKNKLSNKEYKLLKTKELKENGVCVLEIPSDRNGYVDIDILMRKLHEKKIDSILVEGGGELNFSILEKNLASKILAFVSPKILGGRYAKTPVEGVGFDDPNIFKGLEITNISRLDRDILIEGRFHVHGNN